MLPGIWRGLATVAIAASIVPVRGQATECDPQRPDASAVVSGIFSQDADGCDFNGDGKVDAADLVAASLTTAATPTVSATSPPPPSRTPTRTPSPAKSPTTTAPPCPSAGADLAIAIANRTDVSAITVRLSGERLDAECEAGMLPTSYDVSLDCAGDDASTCVQLGGLAAGFWRHSVHVLAPQSAQTQHRTSLLVAGSSPNRIDFTAFASVLTVTTPANAGDGSLRLAIVEAETAAKPALIQFDPAMFPPAVPTSIGLDFSLPALTASDVTIDGADGSGAVGNRIVDARGLPIGALSIRGARNHIFGMSLRNSGANDRDVLNISGPAADGNVIERTLVENAGSADGIGVDDGAGKGFDATANVVRECEVRGSNDKGIKVTTDSYVRVENSWVHDNVNGGVQATIGGHVRADQNLIENNRGGTAQNGLAANATDDGGVADQPSELVTRGNLVRGNGANGISVRGFSVADLRDDYVAVNGSSGLRVYNDIGPPATAAVRGVSMVCNAVDGGVVADSSRADFGGGSLGSPGDNAFAQNNLPGGGANLRNATGQLLPAANNQWENCGREVVCSAADIAAFDLADHGANTDFLPAQAHRAQQPVLTQAVPSKGVRGDLLRIFGSGFNVVDGHFAEDQCADVSGRNRCVPLRGNCVRVNGISAPLEAVTPTMLVVRWPFTCLEPVPLHVTVDHGATGATSNTLLVCTNEEASPAGTPSPVPSPTPTSTPE